MPRRWIRWPARWSVVGVALLSLTAGAAGVVVPRPAYADLTEQIRQTQARLDALNSAAESAAERYDAGQIRLSRAKQVSQVAAATVVHDDVAVAALRKGAGSFAAQVYRGGATTMNLEVLSTASNPTALLEGLGALNHVARSQADALFRLATARHRQAASAQVARLALARQQQVVRDLSAAKFAVEHDAQQLQDLLHELQVKQAALIQAAVDAAARRAAERRAVELAAQAQANAAALVAFSRRPADLGTTSAGTVVAQYAGDAAQVAVRVAEQQLGKAYVWGAEGPDVFDCSGLTKFAYGAAGVALPHYTGDQWGVGRHVSESELQPGDLIFFHADLHHMAMYIGGGQLIHAPHSGDVVQIAQLAGWFQENYAGAVRVVG